MTVAWTVQCPPPPSRVGSEPVIVYEVSCTDCPSTSRHTEPREALAAVKAHVCVRPRNVEGLFICESCGRSVPMLVDDGPLCMRCDALHFPAHLDDLSPAPLAVAS